jgi:hypothetical protein
VEADVHAGLSEILRGHTFVGMVRPGFLHAMHCDLTESTT